MPYFKFTLYIQDGATEENKEKEQEKKEGDDAEAQEKVKANK